MQVLAIASGYVTMTSLAIEEGGAGVVKMVESVRETVAVINGEDATLSDDVEQTSRDDSSSDQ